MKHVALALVPLVLGCGSRQVGPAPTNPGVGLLSATQYEGTPYVPGLDELVFEEEATGTQFNLVGQAFSGEWADQRMQLAVLPGITAFWFAWTTHHPGARLFPEGTVNPGDVILADKRCGVPCDEIVPGCAGGLDCIPAIDKPVWIGPDRHATQGTLLPDDRVLGIARGGAARAYPLDDLWTHEIVNDTWGDWDFSVTYCPLTASGVLVDGRQDGSSMRFGVSGNLYNSNLVMYDRTTKSLYGQMRLIGISGDHLGLPLGVAGLIDTTWSAWVQMYPHTEVLDERFSSGYPYGDYRSDHNDTFMQNNPAPDDTHPAKVYATGLTSGGETVVWPAPALREQAGEYGFVEDVVGELPVLVAFDLRTSTLVVLSRLVDGQEVHFRPVAR